MLTFAHQKFLASYRPLECCFASAGSEIKQSTARSTQIDLEHIGKSVDDIDVAFPRQLKTDLSLLALKHRFSPSSYVRKMLVQQLLGEQVNTGRQDAVGAISKDVLAIEKD